VSKSKVKSGNYWVLWAVYCSPVYPTEEADDENVVDDSGATELTLDKIEDDTVLVILLLIFLSALTELLFHKMPLMAPLELHLTTSELWFGQEQEGILP